MNYEIKELNNLPLPELKALFQEVLGKSPPTYTCREFLINNLIYQKHVSKQGELNKKSQRRLLQLYKEFKKNPQYRPPASRQALKSGTRLVREWQGTAHTVTVITNGFEYQHVNYKSLSEIARLITGTRWSGPAFFGLNKGANV